MRWGRAGWAVVCGLLAVGLCGTAAAAEPGFDCSRAQATVERLVCAEPTLAERDRALQAAYRAASARATGAQARRLAQDQRAWIKGRNDCWKATRTTWITATWTVDTVPACVEASYRLRTAELQAMWQLVSSARLTLHCSSQPADELIASFYATDPPTLRLERGDRAALLWQVGPADAQRFEGRNVEARRTAGGLTVHGLGTAPGRTDTLDCQQP